MKEKDVAQLAELLGKKPEEVSAAIEKEGGISEIIEEFSSGHKVFTTTELDGLKTNLKSEFEHELLNGEIPKDVYDRAKGFALEATQKKIAKRYGISEYDAGMDSLVDKIVESKAKNPEDVTDYKAQINKLIEDHGKELEEERKANDNRFLSLRLNEFINSVPIDAEGTKLENQRKVLRAMVTSEFAFDIDSDKVAIKDAPVRFKQDNLDPIPVVDVLTEFAKDYVNLRSEGGGRGDSSSTSRSSAKTVDFKAYMEKNGIQKNSVEQYKAMKKFEEDGIEII